VRHRLLSFENRAFGTDHTYTHYACTLKLELLPGSYPYRLRVICVPSIGIFSWGEDRKGASEAVRRCCMGSPNSEKNQGKLRTNQSQLTPAQDYERKRKFRVPRFVADYEDVLSIVSDEAPERWPLSLVQRNVARTVSANDFFFGVLHSKRLSDRSHAAS